MSPTVAVKVKHASPLLPAHFSANSGLTEIVGLWFGWVVVVTVVVVVDVVVDVVDATVVVVDEVVLVVVSPPPPRVVVVTEGNVVDGSITVTATVPVTLTSTVP